MTSIQYWLPMSNEFPGPDSGLGRDVQSKLVKDRDKILAVVGCNVGGTLPFVGIEGRPSLTVHHSVPVDDVWVDFMSVNVMADLANYYPLATAPTAESAIR